MKPVRLEELSRIHQWEVTGIWLNDGASALRYYDTGNVPRGWSGRFNQREFARARQEQGERAAHLQPPGRAAAGPLMEPVRERPDKKEQSPEPNRPEEWSLDGVVVGTMTREQCRVAELPAGKRDPEEP